jgi:antirestriction protein ArdC
MQKCRRASQLGAAFLCAEFAFDGDLRHAGYIGHWIELLKADDLLHRLQSCFKGNDYLRGLALAAPIEAAA